MHNSKNNLHLIKSTLPFFPFPLKPQKTWYSFPKSNYYRNLTFILHLLFSYWWLPAYINDNWARDYFLWNWLSYLSYRDFGSLILISLFLHLDRFLYQKRTNTLGSFLFLYRFLDNILSLELAKVNKHIWRKIFISNSKVKKKLRVKVVELSNA